MRHAGRLLVLLPLVLGCSGDGGGGPSDVDPDAIASVEIDPSASTLVLGGKGFFSATVRNGRDQDVTSSAQITWSTLSSSVATAEGNGADATVTAAGVGSTTLRARASGVTGEADVTVRNPAPPPFSGTIFIDPDIITSDDPTAFESLADAGQGSRSMFDRRVNGFITVNAYLFNVTYDDGLSSEIQVNPEFGSVDAARTQARKYAEVLGRLPTVLRQDIQTVWIHMGVQPFGGGNFNVLIHTGQSALYEQDGILEETLAHESSHTSLDRLHADAPGWLAAQNADPTYISTYARDNPTREDVAETFVPYIAIRYRADRIAASLRQTIEAAIPARIAYLDGLQLDMYPID